MAAVVGIDEDTDIDEFEDMFSIDDENESRSSNQSKSRDEMLKELIAEAEQAVVEALASENTDSGVYKGLQRHLNKRDQKIAQLEQYIATLEQERQKNQEQFSELEFLKNVIPKMLDPTDREVFNKERDQFLADSKNTKLEETLQALMNQQRAMQYVPQQQGSEDEDPRLTEYRKQATAELQGIAELLGVDPSDKRVDLGNDKDPLATRIAKLRESASKIKKEDGDISSVRKKKVVDTNTRNNVGTGKQPVPRGQELVRRGMAQLLERMEQL